MAYPHYTRCCELKDYKLAPSDTEIYTAVGFIVAFIVSSIWTGLSGIDAALLTFAAEALIYVKWWLYTRLICMPADSSSTRNHLVCAIGVLVSVDKQTGKTIPDAWDTDYSFDLALAPNPISNEILDPNYLADLAAAPNPIANNTKLEQDAANDKKLKQQAAEVVAPQGDLVAEDVKIKDKMTALGKSDIFGNFATDSNQSCFASDLKGNKDYTAYSQQRTTATLHCEIEGRGMFNLIAPLEAVIGLTAVAEVLSWFCSIPVIGWILCAIAALLTVAAAAVVIAGALQAFNNDSAKPSDVNPELGKTLHTNECNGLGADILLVSGEWIYDSFHPTTGNEIHPVQHVQKVPNGYDIPIDGTPAPIFQWDGQWHLNPDDIKVWCGMVADASSPTTQTNQENPENQWEVHPDVDGCDPTPVIP